MTVGTNVHFDSPGSPILGVSGWAGSIRAEIARAAPYASNVLITGPSGTGKELIARALHAHSPRADKPFIPVDCAAATGTLFASHLFGHVQGAFTGATHDEIGCFRAGDGGTVLLDEIGELDLELQGKLLRVLQERCVVPVGSHKEISVDVRVVAATNRDLKNDVAAGRFREDLYYRLNVVPIQTLPLKDHAEDIDVLAPYFLARLAANNGLPLKHLSPRALQRMRRYHWPGNVREMENVLERAALFTEGEGIGPDDIPLETLADTTSADRALPDTAQPEQQRPVASNTQTPASQDGAGSLPGDEDQWPTMAEVQRDHIRRTLEHTNFNQSAAARLLGMERHQLARKIQEFGLELPRSRRGRPRKERVAPLRPR